LTTTDFVPFDITICGLDELDRQCAEGRSHILSILDPDWPLPFALQEPRRHAWLELRFHDVIDEAPDYVPPQIPPQASHVEDILAFGRALHRAPPEAAHLLIHCHMGVSRSTAAMTLILAQARPDRPAAEAMAEVRRIRPKAWPNLRMIELGDALLGRRGQIVAAVREHYRSIMTENPTVAETMIAFGRGREVLHG
jgi:predicted protein tyrosine phosphatase